MVDHQDIYDLMQEGKSFEEAYDEAAAGKRAPGGKQMPKKEKEPPADTILPVFPPRKGKKVVKTAKAGGIISASKRGDGCAQRGKTKGRMV